MLTTQGTKMLDGRSEIPTDLNRLGQRPSSKRAKPEPLVLDSSHDTRAQQKTFKVTVRDTKAQMDQSLFTATKICKGEFHTWMAGVGPLLQLEDPFK